MRHIKIKSSANIFDKSYELYFEQRELKKWKRKGILARKEAQLRKQQLSKCPYCGQMIYLSQETDIHRKVYLVDGGTDKTDNLQLLHKDCHEQLHNAKKANSHVIVA